jgi:hypothetical protein
VLSAWILAKPASRALKRLVSAVKSITSSLAPVALLLVPIQL